jgi:FKBP-type peptidyl-prolyl cis-trans isomerase 2
MAVEQGNDVKVEYEGRLESGEVFDSTKKHGGEPLAFEVGAGQMIKGFDDAVVGMELGEEKEITLAPKDAYGEREEQAVQKVPRSMMPDGVEVGLQIGIPLEDGNVIPAIIIEMDDKQVTIDMSHELAGKTLIFKIKIVGIE